MQGASLGTHIKRWFKAADGIQTSPLPMEQIDQVRSSWWRCRTRMSPMPRCIRCGCRQPGTRLAAGCAPRLRDRYFAVRHQQHRRRAQRKPGCTAISLNGKSNGYAALIWKGGRCRTTSSNRATCRGDHRVCTRQSRDGNRDGRGDAWAEAAGVQTDHPDQGGDGAPCTVILVKQELPFAQLSEVPA